MDTLSIPSLLNIPWRDILDIALVSLVLYSVILIVKRTRAVAAVYGLMLIIISYFFARFLGLTTLTWLYEGFLNSLFLLVIIIFQSDIRHWLTALGNRQFSLSFRKKKRYSTSALQTICDAAQYMAARKIGALIVIERNVPLTQVVEGGVGINATLSKELLISLFWPNSPLHDGAVIVHDQTIVAGGCILPLSESVTKRDYGTRHRAALGITEQTDALVVVVSEERGVTAVSLNGRLTDSLDEVKLLRVLTTAMER